MLFFIKALSHFHKHEQVTELIFRQWSSQNSKKYITEDGNTDLLSQLFMKH